MKPKFFSTPFGYVLGVQDGPSSCGTLLTSMDGPIVPVLTANRALIQVPIVIRNYTIIQQDNALYLAYKGEIIPSQFHLPHYVRHVDGTIYYSFRGEIRVITTAIVGAIQVRMKQFRSIQKLPVNLDCPGDDIPELLRAMNEGL